VGKISESASKPEMINIGFLAEYPKNSGTKNPS
jgi:hypothetical protein